MSIKAIPFCILLICASLMGCTLSMNMVHTEGQASDVVDDTAANTPNTSIVPAIPLSPR